MPTVQGTRYTVRSNHKKKNQHALSFLTKKQKESEHTCLATNESANFLPVSKAPQLANGPAVASEQAKKHLRNKA